jgi:hypothetical protein
VKRSESKTSVRAFGTAAVMLLGMGCALGLLARASMPSVASSAASPAVGALVVVAAPVSIDR